MMNRVHILSLLTGDIGCVGGNVKEEERAVRESQSSIGKYE